MSNSGMARQPFDYKLSLLLLLSISSLLSIGLYRFRFIYAGVKTFYFLEWNLFLAWIPLVSALALWWLAQHGRKTWLLQLPLLGCWLLFFPNAPYLVTDFVHLTPREGAPFWYDLMLIFSFAWNGLILGFTSLWVVQEVVHAQWGKAASWLLVSFTLATSGFGIYLGRFLNWNSWDLVTNPHELLFDILVPLVNPQVHLRAVAVTLLFSTFLTIAYLTLNLLGRTRWAHNGSSIDAL